MKKLVIVGCGRLAEIVADAVVKGSLPDYDLVGVYSRTASKAAHIVNKMQQHGKPCIADVYKRQALAGESLDSLLNVLYIQDKYRYSDYSVRQKREVSFVLLFSVHGVYSL